MWILGQVLDQMSSSSERKPQVELSISVMELKDHAQPPLLISAIEAVLFLEGGTRVLLLPFLYPKGANPECQ